MSHFPSERKILHIPKGTIVATKARNSMKTYHQTAAYATTVRVTKGLESPESCSYQTSRPNSTLQKAVDTTDCYHTRRPAPLEKVRLTVLQVQSLRRHCQLLYSTSTLWTNKPFKHPVLERFWLLSSLSPSWHL